MLHSKTYDLLISPRYRGLRYLFLGIICLIFSYSETSYHYAHAPAGPFAILFLNALLSKIMVFAILLTLLVPLLLKRRYTAFLLSSLVITGLFVWLQQIILERAICRHFNLYFWRDDTQFVHIWIDILSQNVLWIMVFSGVLMGRLLKFWNLENQEKQQIEASRLQMESEAMKEQISPSLLCDTLHKSGESAQKAPAETSRMLMQLSRILRYQLYDCRHEKVLLDSEINFLREYLSVLKYNGESTNLNTTASDEATRTDFCHETTSEATRTSYGTTASGAPNSKIPDMIEERSDYSVTVIGQTMGIMIPPLLFVPFLQSNDKPEQTTHIHIRFSIHNHILTFDLQDNHTHRNDQNVRRRLEQLYPQKYDLSIKPGHVVLNILI